MAGRGKSAAVLPIHPRREIGSSAYPPCHCGSLSESAAVLPIWRGVPLGSAASEFLRGAKSEAPASDLTLLRRTNRRAGRWSPRSVAAVGRCSTWNIGLPRARCAIGLVPRRIGSGLRLCASWTPTPRIGQVSAPIARFLGPALAVRRGGTRADTPHTRATPGRPGSAIATDSRQSGGAVSDLTIGHAGAPFWPLLAAFGRVLAFFHPPSTRTTSHSLLPICPTPRQIGTAASDLNRRTEPTPVPPPANGRCSSRRPRTI